VRMEEKEEEEEEEKQKQNIRAVGGEARQK
jgi:hypothetical protein